MTRAGLFSAGLLAATSLAASAQPLYRWNDEQGRVHISDTLPPGGAKNVQKKQYNTAPGTAAPSYSMQRATRDFPVVLYSSPDCGDACRQGKALLEKRGVPHREIAVSDQAGIEELKRATGQNQVPVLIVGRTPLSGFEAGAWNAELDTAGYPAR